MTRTDLERPWWKGDRLFRHWAGLAFLCVLTAARPASAVVDASSAANTNTPTDGAPWANVAFVNGASGVYLGAGWVLTASHVGPGDAVLEGKTYVWDNRWLRLTNSDGTATDLDLFHLAALPPLPRIPLVSNTPVALSQVDLIAWGRIAGSGLTTFGSYQGFSWSASGWQSWDNNRINSGSLTTINAGFGNVTVFSTDFSSPSTHGPAGPTSDECNASVGDSGGGVFWQNGTTWQLAGMIDAISDLSGQPADTSVYGDSTYLADIATYRSQIAAVLAGTAPMLTVKKSGAYVVVSWPDNGVTYTLKSSTQLPATNWVSVGAAAQLTNGQFSVPVPATNFASFFSLQ